MTYNSDDLMATMKLRALEEADLGSYRYDVRVVQCDSFPVRFV